MKTNLIFLCMICTGLAFLFPIPASADKVDKEAYVNCMNGTFDSLESYKENNELNVGYKLTWYVRGEKDTTVKIEFVKKMSSCEGVSPFEDPNSIEGKISKDYGFEKIPSKKAKTVIKDTCYTYKITCTPPAGDPVVIDPIIDVPKP